MTTILICGSPGTGKTTIANYLKKYGFEIINLSHFVISNKLYLGYDTIRDSYIIDEEALIKKIKERISKEKNVVIEGIGAEILPDELADLCVVLTCDIKELEKRLKNKGYPPSKIYENLEAERFSIILNTALENFKQKVIVFDTSRYSEVEIVNKILTKLREVEGNL